MECSKGGHKRGTQFVQATSNPKPDNLPDADVGMKNKEELVSGAYLLVPGSSQLLLWGFGFCGFGSILEGDPKLKL